MISVQELSQRAKIAAGILKTVSGQRRADALNRMAGKLLECKDAVFAANAEDIAAAPGLTDAFRKRLQITEKVFKYMLNPIRWGRCLKDVPCLQDFRSNALLFQSV